MPTDDELDLMAYRLGRRLTRMLGDLPDDEPAGMDFAWAQKLLGDPYKNCAHTCTHDLAPGLLVGPLLERDGDYKAQNPWLVLLHDVQRGNR